MEMRKGGGHGSSGKDHHSHGNNKSSNVTAMIDSQYDALLLVKNEQTTCSIALFAPAYGFVAANCIVDSQNKSPLDPSYLAVAIYAPGKAAVSAVSKVTVHPSYDPKTFANNIAIIQFEESAILPAGNANVQSNSPTVVKSEGVDGGYGSNNKTKGEQVKEGEGDGNSSGDKDNAEKKSEKVKRNNDDDNEGDSKCEEEDEDEDEDKDKDRDENKKKAEGNGKSEGSNAEKKNSSQEKTDNYNSNSKSNNKTSSASLSIAVSSEDWLRIGFMRRTLANVSKPAWSPVQVVVGRKDTNETDPVCLAGSAVFAANTDEMACTSISSPALASANPKCEIPLGMAYGLIKTTDAAPTGLYSHTAVFGTGLCSNFAKAHYFILLRNYLAWGASVAGNQPNALMVTPASTGIENNPSFAMKPVDPTKQGITTYGGNLYPFITKSEGSGSGNGNGNGKNTGAGQQKPSATVTVSITSIVYVVGPPPGATNTSQPPVSTPPSPPAASSPSDNASLSNNGSSSGTNDSAASSAPSNNASATDSLQSNIPNISTVKSLDSDIESGLSSPLPTGPSGNDSELGNSLDSEPGESNGNSGGGDGDGDGDGDVYCYAHSDGDGDDDNASSSGSDNDTAASNDQAKSASMPMGAKIAIIVVVLLGIGGTAAYLYFRVWKPRQLAKASHSD
ncbi:hypothetical protein GGI07_001751 [Coemansia sp. Benny D115]|nr:hypothetical protein GGI07_001751 [Coemansia sp. Benny D115]